MSAGIHEPRSSARSLPPDLAIERVAYVDSLGFFATLLFKLLGNEGGAVDRRALRIYDRLIFPLSKCIDTLTGRFFGKNLLLVARKKP